MPVEINKNELKNDTKESKILFETGMNFHNNDDHENAKKYWIDAAKMGNKNAEYYLYQLYIHSGKWGRMNNEEEKQIILYCSSTYGNSEAFEELNKLALGGNIFAQRSVGIIYMNGICIENKIYIKKSKIDAEKWLRLAAKNGDGIAQYNLGLLLAENCRKGEQFDEAVEWMCKASDQNLIDAINKLSSMNSKIARNYFIKLAEDGDVRSHYYLGNMYENGIGGPISLNDAIDEYCYAYENGMIDAYSKIVNIDKDEIEKILTLRIDNTKEKIRGIVTSPEYKQKINYEEVSTELNPIYDYIIDGRMKYGILTGIDRKNCVNLDWEPFTIKELVEYFQWSISFINNIECKIKNEKYIKLFIEEKINDIDYLDSNIEILKLLCKRYKSMAISKSFSKYLEDCEEIIEHKTTYKIEKKDEKYESMFDDNNQICISERDLCNSIDKTLITDLLLSFIEVSLSDPSTMKLYAKRYEKILTDFNEFNYFGPEIKRIELEYSITNDVISKLIKYYKMLDECNKLNVEYQIMFLVKNSIPDQYKINYKHAITLTNAKNGDKNAQYNVGMKYLKSSNYKAGFYWLSKAAEQNEPNSQFQVALLYMNGKIEKSEKLSKKWMHAAYENGVSDAKYFIGLEMENKGKLKEAFSLFEKVAVDKESPYMGKSSYHVGMLMESGFEGRESNNVYALYWYRKAADLHVPEAIYTLGQWYEEGRKGVMKIDKIQANYYYMNAARMGYSKAIEKVGVVNDSSETIKYKRMPYTKTVSKNKIKVRFDDDQIKKHIMDMQIVADEHASDEDTVEDDIEENVECLSGDMESFVNKLNVNQKEYINAVIENKNVDEILNKAGKTKIIFEEEINALSIETIGESLIIDGEIDEEFIEELGGVL